MRFWDSSALVPLVVEEAASPACRDLLVSDAGLAVWALSRVEIISALARKERERELDRAAMRVAIDRLDRLAEMWIEVDALVPVVERAARLLRAHALRAADALQLAAALVLAEERPRGWSFVTAGDRLAQAATAEGFTVHEPSSGR